MIDNITLLTYTHSKCIDLHKYYFGRLDKYFPELRHKLTTCDIHINFTDCIVYNDSDDYSKQMINALNNIKTDYVIYSQEDYILFDYVNILKLSEYINLMNKDSTIHFIRLIKSGIDTNYIKSYNNELSYLNPNSEYYFSTQITLWKKETLINMFNLSKVKSIFDEPKNSYFLKYTNAIGLYTINEGKQVGNHYNSIIYPYIATAKVKGVWNIKEYKTELEDLFYEYNIK